MHWPTGGEVRRSGTATLSAQKDGKVAAQHPAAGGTLDGPTVGANVVCACAGLAGTHVAAREERDVGLCRHAEQATIPRLRGLCVPEDVPLGPSLMFNYFFSSNLGWLTSCAHDFEIQASKLQHRKLETSKTLSLACFDILLNLKYFQNISRNIPKTIVIQ